MAIANGRDREGPGLKLGPFTIFTRTGVVILLPFLGVGLVLFQSIDRMVELL